MDEGLSRAVLKVFVELYRKGLIYKDKRLVNWDPKLLTAISDLEVQQVEIKGHLWHFKYPIEGDRRHLHHGCDDAARDHARRHRGCGASRRCALPASGRQERHPADGRAAHSDRGRRIFRSREGHRRSQDHARPRLQRLRGRAAPQPAAGQRARSRGQSRASKATKRSCATCRARPSSRKLWPITVSTASSCARRSSRAWRRPGCSPRSRRTSHTVPHGDRSGVVIEPFLTEQWYVDAKTLAQPAIAAVRDGRTVFVPRNWEATYFNWMENIQPWCISRQLWWGHQIPAWYGFTVDEKARCCSAAASSSDPMVETFVSEIGAGGDRAGAQILRRGRHRGGRERSRGDGEGLRVATGRASRPGSRSGATRTCSTPGSPPRCGRSRRWAGRKTTRELGRYYPTDVLVTGFDIIFFWVARMMMMGLEFMEEVPFHTVYIHALVRDQHGAKMAKSKGNVIDPLELIDEYGADALRFTLAAMAAQGRDIKLSTQRVEGYRNFATKLWNACRFAEMNDCVTVPGFDPGRSSETLNRWIAHETGKAAREITASDRGLPLQRGRRCRLSLRLEYLLRLVSGNSQAGAAGRRQCRQGRDPRNDRVGPRRDPQAAAPVQAVHHRGAVAADGARRASPRRPARAGAMAEARRSR